MKRIKAKGIEVVVFEPFFNEKSFFGSRAITGLTEFIQIADLFLTNRISYDLVDFDSKVFSRDYR